jgi:hypothetical protein
LIKVMNFQMICGRRWGAWVILGSLLLVGDTLLFVHWLFSKLKPHSQMCTIQVH